MTQSVSFRITRTAEDVAQAINAMSQRLVKLEQRLESLELQVKQQQCTTEMSAEDMARLDDVDRLLLDCQSLLQSTVDAEALPVDSVTEGGFESADEDSEGFKAA